MPYNNNSRELINIFRVNENFFSYGLIVSVRVSFALL